MKIQNRSIDLSGNRKKVDMQRLSPRFRSQQFFPMEDMWRTVFPKFIEICMETPCRRPPRWAPTWRPEISGNICHYKSVNTSLEDLKNVTIILYSNTRTVQIAEFPEISHLLNQHPVM